MTKFLDDQYAVRVMKLLIAPDVSKHDAMNNFQNVVLGLRSLIESLPGGPLKLRQFAVAHRLLMRHLPAVVSEEVKPDDIKLEYLKMLEFVVENQLCLIEEELAVADAIWFFEDGDGLGTPVAGAPTNSTAEVAPQPGEPVINPKKKRLEKIYKREEPQGE
jgi:hypothetical protein